MASQGSLDFTSGPAKRDAALDRLAAKHGAWIDKVVTAIRWFSPGTTFTTDRLWNLCALHGWGDPPEPRAMGAAIIAAKRAGLIASTGRHELSTRPQCHARPVTIWSRR